MSRINVLNDAFVGKAISLEMAKEHILRRIAKSVRILPNGCHEWLGTTNRKGYGMMSVGSRNWTVTRLILAFHVRPLHRNELACHTCDWPKCINPDHLFIGDKRENALDKVAKGTNFYAAKTHCPQGHPYDNENTLVSRGRRGTRNCRNCKICMRAAGRIKAGWPKDLAYSLPPQPLGYRPPGVPQKHKPPSESKS